MFCGKYNVNLIDVISMFRILLFNVFLIIILSMFFINNDLKSQGVNDKENTYIVINKAIKKYVSILLKKTPYYLIYDSLYTEKRANEYVFSNEYDSEGILDTSLLKKPKHITLISIDSVNYMNLYIRVSLPLFNKERNKCRICIIDHHGEFGTHITSLQFMKIFGIWCCKDNIRGLKSRRRNK